uniref:Uncharacterized protein n=1 Tax=viral metagenome TaxID=1070528 RepID=A0A6M3JCX1_9ZZZZ
MATEEKKETIGGLKAQVAALNRKIARNVDDNWDKVSNPNLACSTCHSYLNYRCRRHAPNGQEGWPAVFPTDYCMDHKMSKQTMAKIGGR